MKAKAFSFSCAAIAVLSLSLVGCGSSQPPQTVTSTSTKEIPNEEPATPVPQDADSNTFELYSTLPGKMARMEELLNAIDRFLDDPEFQDRLLADAKEFQQLLNESRGLYPERLPEDEQTKFDETVGQTSATSEELIDSILTNNAAAAREALTELERHRKAAHVRFSR